ncbi:MAG: restriction endonuclease subunit S [Candidatus Woesearchaeota archaeon]|jgi:type I restriction enzyme S subunit|nr:restriction endonuclease subunit S [Candidatus Woesearchaeota archaeon]
MKFRSEEEFFEHDDFGLIPNDWKVDKLFNLALNCDSKRVPLSSAIRKKKQGNFRYYGASGVIDYIDEFIFEGSYLLISEDGENLRSRKAPIAFLASGQFWVNNHAHVLNHENFKRLLYLKYWFANNNISSYLSGSAQPKLSQENLNSILLLIPEKNEEEEKIVDILSSIDDKIENLDTQNKLLENLGIKLFEKYFIRFEDFKGELIWNDELEKDVPKNWKVVQLSKFIKFQKGKKPSEVFEKYSESLVKQILIETLDGNTSFYVKLKGLVISDKYDLIMVMDGASSGRLEIGFEGAIGSTLAKIEINGISNFYIYYFILSFVDEIKNNTTGSAIPHTDKSFILSRYMVEPEKELIDLFDKKVKEVLDKIFENKKQIETLTKLRDKLLPMLISGRIKL